MADPYIIPRRLDDPELIGFWTIDEFAGMLAPFTWGILTQHIFIGIIVAFGAWFALRKAKAGRASSWVAHAAYVSVPETYAARSISFFTTTKKGFVYKVACRVEQIPATQVFITNPAIAKNRAADWESQTPIETSAVRLIQAMANDRTVDGFEVRQSTAIPARVGDLEVQLIADYRGASLTGKVVRIHNRGTKPVTLAERDLAPRDTLAVSIAEPKLEPGASTTAFVVGASGETGND